MVGSTIRKWYQSLNFFDRIKAMLFLIILFSFAILAVFAYIINVRALIYNSSASGLNVIYKQALFEAVCIFTFGLFLTIILVVLANQLLKRFQSNLKIVTDNILSDSMEYHDLPETMPLLEELNMAIKGAKISHNTLKQMEEIFYKAFRYSPILKIIFSLKDKRVFEVNEELLRVMGFKRDELIGRTPEEFMHSSGNEPLSEFCHNTFEKRIMRKNVNMPFSTRYGESREGFFSTEIIHIGHEPYVFMVCVDITDINKMEKEMAQLEKLNLLGQMAASIGHEIRNPMTAIRGFLQLLQRKERYSEDEQFLKLMISEVDRANAIITDFLSLAGKKTGEKTLLDLNIIIKSLFPLLQAQAIKEDKKVELCLKDLPLYMFNENEMKQVILNLVNNALDALGPGGLVRISTRQVEPEGTVIVLMVEDNGCGIPEEIMSRLGTPFTTTKEKGTGLGLAVCYDIVEKHHGQIQVETNCRGTIFTILFPLSDAG